MNGPDGPIETYLDQLVGELSGLRPRQMRHLLAEAEAHLRDDAEAAAAGGMSVHDAESRAVARFGPARDLAVAERAVSLTPLRVLARQTVMSALFLGGIGCLAVGASGLVAAVIGATAGTRVLAGVAPGQVLSASDCARWLAADPGAHSCQAAAVADWAAETVGYRVAAGLLGVVALLAFRVLRRRGIGRTLTTAVSDTIAVTLFGVAGVWTLGLGIDAIAVAGGTGSGQWLSAAPVALAASAVFGLRLVHTLRRPGASDVGDASSGTMMMKG